MIVERPGIGDLMGAFVPGAWEVVSNQWLAASSLLKNEIRGPQGLKPRLKATALTQR